MKITQANKKLKEARNTEKESEVSIIVINKLISENPDSVKKLLLKTGIQQKIESAINLSEKIKVKNSPKGLMVSLDGKNFSPYSPKSVDFYLKNVLKLKDKGFYPLYRKVLADVEIISALACAHALSQF